MFCAEEKLKKKTSDRLISMIKRRNFVIEDICAGTIRELSWKHLQSFTSMVQLGRQVPGFKFRTARFSFTKNARLLFPCVMIVIAGD